ncbi:F-box/LRR-repeat protein 12-like [Vombatus ursinus]|uniref:F-box/LRR-repeat protein 12-like n=1 Tax=Vombatus ursinus TaxID=29139 RepID=UPI000FFD77B2|nr:F-box/LRR-repeat protein 12-like [Vombatus ursinus]
MALGTTKELISLGSGHFLQSAPAPSLCLATRSLLVSLCPKSGHPQLPRAAPEPGLPITQPWPQTPAAPPSGLALTQDAPSRSSSCLTEHPLRHQVSALYGRREAEASCRLLRVELQSCELPQAWFPPGNGPSSLPHLEHLVLDQIPAFSDSQLRALPRQGALCSLVLRVTYRVTHQGLRDALPGLGHLRRLELCGCSVPADGALPVIGGFLPRLRELRVTVAGLTARGLASLVGMQALETLGLLGPPPTPDKLSAKDILPFCLLLPNLRVLSLQGMGLGSADEALLREGLAHCMIQKNTRFGKLSYLFSHGDHIIP